MDSSKSCEYCLNYVYDEELGCCVCEAELDMDDIERLESGSMRDCPLYMVNN